MSNNVFSPTGNAAGAVPDTAASDVQDFVPRSVPDPSFGEKDIDVSGAQLANDMADKGYQPVIFVGNAGSGKTSVLLSLIALLKRRPDLKVSAFLDPPLLDVSSKLGSYQNDNAETFFFKNVQRFIDGNVIPKTTIEVPFFVPVSVRPETSPRVTFAFMESNGEWYRPKKDTNALFPPLRKSIEEFIQTYQGGIIFIYTLPFTQQMLWSSDVQPERDAGAIQEADLAIAGAMQSYERVRYDKTHDRHLFLITKWDGSATGGNLAEALSGTQEGEVSQFAEARFPQSLALINGLGIGKEQVALQHYCSGIINAQGPQQLSPTNPLRDVVLSYPKNLWIYLYKQALVNAASPASELFPPPPPKPWWQRLLDSI